MNILRTRDVKMPVRAHATDAGMDVFIPNKDNFFKRETDGTYTKLEETYLLMPGESILVAGGFRANVPENHALIAFNKSGVATKKNLVVGAQVIDEPYQGEIHIDMHNIGRDPMPITVGDKITQLVCLPVNYVTPNEVMTEEECFGGVKTDRAEGGFGSSDKKEN